MSWRGSVALSPAMQGHFMYSMPLNRKLVQAVLLTKQKCFWINMQQPDNKWMPLRTEVD